jgi:hypothetical protein
VDGAPPAWSWREIAQGLHFDASAGPFWLARSVAERLRAVDRPLLVVLDDVHRADELTLQLLRQVVDQLADAPVLILATFRSTEGGEALAATRAALAAASAHHLTLGGLDEAGVAVLARSFGLEAPPRSWRCSASGPAATRCSCGSSPSWSSRRAPRPGGRPCPRACARCCAGGWLAVHPHVLVVAPDLFAGLHPRAAG